MTLQQYLSTLDYQPILTVPLIDTPNDGRIVSPGVAIKDLIYNTYFLVGDGICEHGLWERDSTDYDGWAWAIPQVDGKEWKECPHCKHHRSTTCEDCTGSGWIK